eukprot:GFUD01036502.1.p1 GENE.GFUD01036502.1~~GFUD01036502.1.p1  ORF type:complete len:613 (-),score=133.24 GFUD01036502.1:90-1928(-)
MLLQYRRLVTHLCSASSLSSTPPCLTSTSSLFSKYRRLHIPIPDPVLCGDKSDDPNVLYSQIPDLDIPHTHFSSLVWSSVNTSPNSPYRSALVNGDTGQTYSYKESFTLTKRFASALAKFGAARGDVLALILPNQPEFVFVFTGAPMVGVTVTTIPPSFTHYEMTHQLASSGATWIVTDLVTFETVRKAVSNLEVGQASGWGETLAMRSETIKIVLTSDMSQNPPATIPLSLMLADDGTYYPAEPVFNWKDDVVAIPYSSGTTGPPKGVQLTHSNMVSNMYQISCHEMGLLQPANRDAREITICILPMYHVFAMNVTMTNTLLAGGKLVTLSSFNPLTFLSAMITYKPTFLHLAPPLLAFLAMHPGVKPHHLESLRYILVAAAPVVPSLIRSFMEKATHVELREGWGMSELSPAACFSPQGCSVVGSCGRVLPNTQVKLINVETGASLGTGEPGELLVRGPQVMKGYLNNPTATEETLKDGWLWSGDIAYRDEDGNLYMVDRMKEMIKVKALQVSPSELEDIIRTNSEVLDAAVLSFPDERFGEVPRAFVVKRNRKGDNQAISKEIHDHLNERVSDHKTLRGGVVFLDSIPRSPAGKILKKNLKTLARVEAW